MRNFTKHYIWQRITACVLLVLVPWFLWVIFSIKNLDYSSTLKILSSPNSVVLVFFMLTSGFYHGYLGVHTICLDYLPSTKIRSAIIFMVGAIFIFFVIFSAFCLMHLVTLGY